ncbi:MAG: hypothetical protein GX640_01410, partial [Fibrobacter sp.]|nr:hypothetical protein [Fibrobacter sp.]
MNSRIVMVVAGLSVTLLSAVNAQQPVVLTLADCIQEGLDANIKLSSAREKIREVESIIKEQRAGYYPKLSSSAGISGMPELPEMDLPFAVGGMLNGITSRNYAITASATLT